MRDLLLAALLPAVAACAPAAAQDPPGAATTQVGPLTVVLLGDYVGKPVRIFADGRVLADRRFTFPPPGAEERLDIRSGPVGTVRLRVEIDGCPAAWERDLVVAPFKPASLIFDGCAVRALPAE